jgi:hypothetical protein
MEFQKRFPDDYLITTLKRLPVSRQKPAPSINEGAVGRAKVFDEELAVLIHDSRVTARYLGFRVVLIKVDIREYPAIRIPSSNVSFAIGNREFLTNSASAFYDELATYLDFARLDPRFVRPESIGSTPGSQHKCLARTGRVSRHSGLRGATDTLRLALIVQRPCRLGDARGSGE